MFRLKKFDFSLFLIAVFLLGFGIVIVASVSPDNLFNFLFYTAFSLLFFFFFSLLDLEILFPLSPLIYLFSIVFLLLPFILGTVTRGSVRWITLAGLTIQPSEIVKPFLALVSAWFWAKKSFSFRNFFHYSLVFFPALVLIFLQPDLGSTLVVFSIFVGNVLVSGVKFKQILILVLIVLLVTPATWFLLKDYQRARIVHFLNPQSDPLGRGYNLIQAKITVGSGRVFGRGIGRGTQSHLAFLPERHTDFVFASLSEELGLVGAGLVLLLYLLFLLRILKLASLSGKRSYFLLSWGLFFYLTFQIVVNVGMNIGLLPITGITLPLISYGGSSLLATMITLGILESVSRQKKEDELVEIK